MSGSELHRIEVLSEVLARKRTEVSAAAIPTDLEDRKSGNFTHPTAPR